MEFNLETIIAIGAGISSLGLIAVVRNIIKELKEAHKKWEEINADGVRTEKELIEFAKEAMDVISEAVRLGYIIKKLFGMAKKKK